jgi:two-component system, LytTR family, response regulator
MKSIRILIVDDEEPARARVRSLLAAEKDIEIAGEAANGDEAITAICTLRPDLLFLDVQMPAPDGIAVLRAVREEWLPCTIFTTAHAEHAVAAFELHALDYLLKPYSRARFSDALTRARAHLAARASTADGDTRVSALLDASAEARGPVERFLVKTSERYIVVRAAEIVWVESADNYVILHTPSGNHVLRRSLSALEGELDARKFFRTSRSTIVKLDAVAEIQPLKAGEHVIILRDKTRVPLTRGLREFQDRLQSGR